MVENVLRRVVEASAAVVQETASVTVLLETVREQAMRIAGTGLAAVATTVEELPGSVCAAAIRLELNGSDGATQAVLLFAGELGAAEREGLERFAVVAGRAIEMARLMQGYKDRALQAREAMRVLAGERASLQALLEEIPVGVLVADAPGGRVVLGNRGMQKVLGREMPYISGLRDYRTLGLQQAGGQAFSCEEHPLARALRGETVADVEALCPRPEGLPALLSITATPIYNSAGEMVKTVAVFADMTDRKLSEARMEELSRRLTTVLESTSDCVMLLNPDWTLAYLNRRAQETLALPEGELTPLAIGARFFEECKAAMNDQVPRYFEEFYEGSKTWFEVRAYPSRSALAVFFRDVTKDKVFAEGLRQSQKMEAVGQLAGGVAHDFNNLLTVINGYSAQLLDRIPASAPYRREIDSIRFAGERAAHLTRQLLAFSRKQVLQPKVLHLNGIVETILPMLSRLIPAEIEITPLLERRLPTIFADPFQLEQIVMNLVINARDAMPRGGSITIETGIAVLDEECAQTRSEIEPGEYVMLAVSDTGGGMDANTTARIFEPFFTTKPQGEGTGLGLSTVFGIVKQSGGHIWVYSEPGLGTTFKVYMPAHGAEPEAAAAPDVEKRGGSTSETVLLVEDDERVRALAISVLEECGYRLLAACDGGEALRMLTLHGKSVDLLLTDLVLPKMGGREIAERYLMARPDGAVLFVSGYSESAIVYRGELSLGVNYLAKPFTPELLRKKVRKVLEKTSSVRSVIVVDDDSALRELLIQVLREDGYRVRGARNGREAVEAHRVSPADLIVMDLVMPDQEGIETIQIFSARYPQVKIIAVSGAFDGRFLRDAEMLGAKATLQKPIRAEVLLETVKRLLEA